jgi:DnaJ-class molecular chaperone
MAKANIDEYIDEAEFDDVICSTCNGSGEGMWDGSVCRSCKGSGVYMWYKSE